MTEEGPRRRPHTYTVAALLGIFVAAVVLAGISRLLPGRLSRLARHMFGGGEAERQDEQE
jgi:hypothetical protein